MYVYMYKVINTFMYRVCVCVCGSSRTRTISENATEEERAVREEGVARASSPLTQGRISSDESEGEGTDEPADWHSSPCHPKPVAVPNGLYFIHFKKSAVWTQTPTGPMRSLYFSFQVLCLGPFFFIYFFLLLIIIHQRSSFRCI